MKKTLKCYLVGGAVRDLLLGLDPKDLDYTCECSFEELRDYLINNLKVEILHEKPEFLTMRVRRPDKVVVDFACCRKEADYDGRRPSTVETATIEQDLSRRDFTINAMAMEVDQDFVPTKTIIDPFNGQDHLGSMLLKFVGNPVERLTEDGLRWFRAIRFNITRNFSFSGDLHNLIYNEDCTKFLHGVSPERVREELIRCFKHSTFRTIKLLSEVTTDWCPKEMWLEPTLAEK